MPVLSDPQREIFAQELAKGTLKCEAYVAAGFKANTGNSCRLADKPEVKARVAEILEAGAKRAEVTVERIMSELAKIGFSDIRKLFDENGNLKRVEDIDDAAAAALSSIDVVNRKVPGGDGNEVESVVKLKFWDKQAALVNMGKHLGMFVDRVEHTGKDGGPIQTEELSDTEKARRIAFALTRAAQSSE